MTTAIVPFDILPAQKTDTGILQLSKIEVNEAYSRKWNVRERDFVCLTRNGATAAQHALSHWRDKSS